MKSTNSINYELRPNKFVERRMFVSSLARIMGYFKQKYQYIGFGGIAFTDFKLIHKELNIEELHSIEKMYSKDKLEFNKPYAQIQIEHDSSTNVLTKIDLTKPTIIWLDYDNRLEPFMFDDLNIVLQDIPIGSIYVMSCNSILKNDNNKTLSLAELKNKFQDLVPFNIPDNCCAEKNAPMTVSRMIGDACDKNIKNRCRLGEQIHFQKLYNFTYTDNQAPMLTYGGIVLPNNTTIANLQLDDFPFINTAYVYEINIPNFTLREMSYINHSITDEDKINHEMIEKSIVKQKEYENYKKFYKYIPNFFDVRI